MKTLTRQMSFSLQRSPLFAGLALLLLAGMPPHTKTALDTQSTIVQAESAEQAAKLVRDVGGTVTHELGIIDAVAANLSAVQLDAIRQSAVGTRIYDNGRAELAAKGGKDGGGETTTVPPAAAMYASRTWSCIWTTRTAARWRASAGRPTCLWRPPPP
jgi:hypothetical protein